MVLTDEHDAKIILANDNPNKPVLKNGFILLLILNYATLLKLYN